jgi:hypothetical protein
MVPSATHESGHFYFAQSGHSHFAATLELSRLDVPAILSMMGRSMQRSMR